MEFDVTSAAAMIWRLPGGFTARMKKPRRLNVPELVEGLYEGNMGLNVNFVVIFVNLKGYCTIILGDYRNSQVRYPRIKPPIHPVRRLVR